LLGAPKIRVRNLQKSLFMAFDLKPLTNEIIHKMNYGPHTLWIVKLDDEVFGPFEIESLKHYAAENEHQFETALASRMDTMTGSHFFLMHIFYQLQITYKLSDKD
jgi:hypothetical protein